MVVVVGAVTVGIAVSGEDGGGRAEYHFVKMELKKKVREY